MFIQVDMNKNDIKKILSTSYNQKTLSDKTYFTQI